MILWAQLGKLRYYLVKYSPKREKSLGVLSENVEGEFDEDIENKSTSLDKLCLTRWTVRAKCFQKIIDYYQYKIEDEFHLIFECPKYSELRINAFSTIEKNEDINLAHDSNVEKLQYFFSQASLYSINIFAAFIKLAFESRQNNNSDFSFIIII